MTRIIALVSLRAFASETAIYGVSSILGRGLYFLLVPIYTGLFSRYEFGVQTDVFTVIGFLMVLATLRLDVAYFRFYGKIEESSLFSTTWLANTGLAALFGFCLLGLSPKLAMWSGYPEYQWVFALGGGILLFDAMVELPLAKLRMEQRPWRFAIVRMIGILINLGLNLLWLVALPKWTDAPSWLTAPASGIANIFVANLIASAAVFLLLSPTFKKVRFTFDIVLLRQLLSFSLPLVIVGFSYVINELLDRKLLPLLWPGGKTEGLELLGVYGANYKLAMLLALFTQAFRYGAEPFFFRESGSEDAREKYARVAKFYLIAALIGFLGVGLFLPIFSGVIIQDASFRVGSDVVPILLLANLCLGMYYNFSVWYKVTDNTKFGAYISVGGALITIVLNVLLIPVLGFYGCAWTTLICYFIMSVASWYFGERNYPIPYAWSTMTSYTTIALALFAGYWWLSPKLASLVVGSSSSVLDLVVAGAPWTTDGAAWSLWLFNQGLAMVLLGGFVAWVFVRERKR